MITRAQAEALLTLAESLEACERNGLYLTVPGRGEVVLDCSGQQEVNVDLDASQITGMALRLAVNALIPKQEL